MPWRTIEKLPGYKAITLPIHGPVMLFRIRGKRSHWLVGRYRALTGLATALRTDTDLRALLVRQQVRLGLRKDDVPPAEVARQERYGPSKAGADRHTDFSDDRVRTLAPPVSDQGPAPDNRRSDREQNVESFWATQTPQSHHIVEFNNLETLGVSRKTGNRDQDYQELPAVLLAAEFHQRYITAVLRPAQRWSRARLLTDIVGVYRRLYRDRSPLFHPLWDISRAILAEAGLGGR